MVNGIEKFKEKFESFKGKYTLIGGVACGLLMDDAGLDFRATQDFDIVLIIESMDEDFGKAIWDFIREGGYKIREKSTGEPEFYRFKSPEDRSYPKEIELFSRKSKLLNFTDEDRLTPIHISDEISSLSAILLDDEYYSFLSHGLTEIEGIQVLNYTHIIPFKAKAWLDLKERKENGETVDSKNILKHKNDVFRLSQLLAETDSIILSDGIKADMASFVLQMENEDVDLKNLKIRGNKKDILSFISKVYKIN
ncbi:MAG: hypothetical protein IJB43_01775 [Clostridia bacterium]|nr:hypothetical protein [Clostridia bacterium]